MTAFQLGPFVLSAPRFYAALGLLVLVLVAELVIWRRRRGERTPVEGRAPGASSAGWAWNAAFTVLIGARVGYVIENFNLFLGQPLAIVQFWQGGYSPWWGIGAGLLAVAWAVRKRDVRLNAVLLPAVLALGTWLLVPAILSPAQQSDKRLPALVIERLEGGELDLATLAGQPVVINLWATWCPPCRRELPMLASASRSHPDVHFVFADQVESRAAVLAYLNERDDLALDGVVLDSNGRLADEFGAVGLPTTLFFDAEGRHALTHAGELSSVMMTNYLADLGAVQTR